MTYRKRLTLIALVAGVAVAPLFAQQSPEPQPRVRRGRQLQTPRNQSPEIALRLRERLHLTEDQVAQLQARRQDLIELRSQQRHELAELRSKFRSGDLTREQLREQMTAQRERARALASDRAGMGDVLTEAQREQLGTIRRDVTRMQMRAFQRGRASARAHRQEIGARQGARGFRGARGMRGARGQRAQRAQRPAIRLRAHRPPGSF